MLNAQHVKTLNDVLNLLLAQKETELAQRVNLILTQDAATRSAISDAAKARGPATGAGRPSHLYKLEVEPGWVQTVEGAKAACAAVADALTTLGSKRHPPKPHSMAVMLSRNGAWFTTVDTDNGTVSISVTKAE
jgi:hypothetical protein